MHKLSVLVIAFGAATAAADSKPTLTLGTPTAIAGTADAKAVTAVMKAAQSKLLACYKDELAKQSYVRGTATATFKVAVDGKVSSVTVTGLASSETAPVHNCIAGAIAELRFAKPKDGEVVEIAVPLTFAAGNPATDEIYGGLVGNEVGGFGTTIGTGRYGTIGQGTGSGFGVGAGGLRSSTAGAPVVSIGQPVVKGDLDKAIIRRYIKRNIQKITYCYEKELLVTSTLQGTITAQFTIGADGIVPSATATGLKNTNVETCVANVIKNIEFPKPKAGEVAVTYPLSFRPPPKPPRAKKK